MIRKCPTCKKKTTYSYCKECDTQTLPFLMENKNNKSKKSLLVGKTTKENLRQKHLLPKTIFDIHNVRYSFRKTRDNIKFNKGRIVPMKNNNYRILRYNDHSVRVYNNCIMITTKTRYKTTNPVETEAEINKELTSVILEFCRENDFEVYEIGERVYIEVKDLDTKTSINFKSLFYKGVYPPDTPVESINPKTAIQDAIILNSKAKDVKSLLTEMNESIKLEIYNKQLHQSVLKEMLVTQKGIQENTKPKGLLTRLKRWFK